MRFPNWQPSCPSVSAPRPQSFTSGRHGITLKRTPEHRGSSAMVKARTKTSGSYSPRMQDAIRRRATELFRRSGSVPGHDLENWCQAELEILQEQATHLVRPAVV